MARDALTNRLVDHDKIAQARLLDATGKSAEALEIYRALLKKHPMASDLQFVVAKILHERNDHVRSLEHINLAIKVDPRKAHYHAMRGMVLSALSRLEEGLESVRKGLDIKADDPLSQFSWASLLLLDNRSGEAVAFIEERADAGKLDDLRMVNSYATALGNVGRHADGVKVLRERIEREGTADRAVSGMSFRMGSLLDKLKRYDEAFEAFDRGNRLREAVHNSDREDDLHLGRMRTWTREFMDGLPHARTASEVPVFIVGMPRSGTTLTEQIIGSHPQAFGAGERPNLSRASQELFEPGEGAPQPVGPRLTLKQGAVDRIARRELREMDKIGGGALRVTDKRPQNFLLVGLIEVLFPGARIIHCKRDPIDTCMSCYFQDFGGPLNQGYTYDLHHLGWYYRNYAELMEHWKSVTKLPVFEVQYEEMVSNQEQLSRELIDFIGLDWDDACLAFHKSDRKVVTLSTQQVSKPMYKSSVKRWKNYEAHLDPLIDALGDLADV